MELHNWYLEKTISGDCILVGNIKNDTRGKFPDGDQVGTSRLESIDFIKREAKTKNSLYKLK